MIKTNSFSKKFFKESIKLHWKALLISGIINPIVIYLYFLTILSYGYSIAAFLLYTSGIFLLIFLMITKMDNISKITIICFVLAIVGVAIILEFWNGLILTLGLITGLLSGFTLAILIFYKKIIYNKRANPNIQLYTEGDFDLFLTWWVTLSIILFFFPFGIFDLPKLTIIDLIYCLILGLIPTALAFALYNVGVKNDKGGNIIVLAYIEPLVATILTVLILTEISIFTIIGGGLILMANFLALKYSKLNK